MFFLHETAPAVDSFFKLSLRIFIDSLLSFNLATRSALTDHLPSGRGIKSATTWRTLQQRKTGPPCSTTFLNSSRSPSAWRTSFDAGAAADFLLSSNPLQQHNSRYLLSPRASRREESAFSW
jgi:hypothetical protein